MRSMLVPILALAAGTSFIAPSRPRGSAAPSARTVDERAAFITTLGQDTVAAETFTRTASRVEGDVIVRVPGTVLSQYVLNLNADGSPASTVVDVQPLGTTAVQAEHLALTFTDGKLHIQASSGGEQQSADRAIPHGAFPFFMTGFNASYGLYSALGPYEAFLKHVAPATSDSMVVPGIDMANARLTTRTFVRRSPTIVDVDYFGVAWTHLVLDQDGSITGADASLTTEKTMTRRTKYFDARALAAAFAKADRAGHALGAASPDRTIHGTVNGHAVSVTYGSPRRRGRTILGGLVPFGQVWRTGANAATVITFANDAVVGKTTIPAGSYSLWTLPKADGSVTLIINRQHGQWGTNYDSSRNLAEIPMQVSRTSKPRENFKIDITNGGQSTLQMAWDTFVWSVPLR